MCGYGGGGLLYGFALRLLWVRFASGPGPVRVRSGSALADPDRNMKANQSKNLLPEIDQLCVMLGSKYFGIHFFLEI